MINRFRHRDINKCRAWLREAGLKLTPEKGWFSADEGGIRVGWISFGYDKDGRHFWEGYITDTSESE